MAVVRKNSAQKQILSNTLLCASYNTDLHTSDVSSEDDEVPTDPLGSVLLKAGVDLPLKTGLLNSGGDNALFCIFAISDGLKFPLEYLLTATLGGTGKWPKFGFVVLSTKIFFFNWGGGVLGFGGFRSNEPTAEVVLRTAKGVVLGDTDGEGVGLTLS